MTDHVLIPRATLEQINAAMYLSHWTDKFIAAHMAVQAALAAPCEPVGEVRAKSDAYGGTFVLWKQLSVAGMTLYAAPKEPTT